VLPRQRIQAVRFFEWQTSQQCRVHDGEPHRVRANAERQRRDGRGGEPAIACNQPEREAQVLHHRVEGRQSADVPVAIPERSRGAEANPRGARRVLRGHAPPDVVVGQHRQVGVKLLLEVGIHAVAAQERPHSRREVFQPAQDHDFPPRSSSSRPMTPETRSQCSVAAASCFRPALEME
jgi:hypothetical protein